MAGLLPLLFALIIAHGAELAYPDAQPSGAAVLAMVASGFVWLALSVLVARLLAGRCGWRSLRLADGLGLAVVLLLHAWWCVALAWVGITSWSVVMLFPVVVALLGHWYALGIASGQGGGHRNLAALWLRGRLVLLPALILITVVDVFQAFASLAILDTWWASTWGALSLIVLSLLAPLVVLALLPPLLVRFWGARPIADHDLRQEINRWCVLARVRVRSVLVWPSKGVPFYNAAVLGLLPRWRFVLLSEDLLRDCSSDEIRAVVGHELGHARHGHLWLYLIFLLATGIWAQWLTLAVLGIMGPSAPWVEVVVWAVVWIVLLRVGFGVVSRACERQADLVGGEVAGDDQHMASALAAVARLSGADPSEPNWRHHSIAERVAFLGRLRNAPQQRTSHHRSIMNLRILILILLAVGLTMTFMAPPRFAELATLREADARLDAALSTAQEGNRGPLQTWLLQQTPSNRQVLARAILRRLEDDTIHADDRLLYAHRHWLLPFVEVSTGNDLIDLRLDNALGYALSAGTPQPSESELVILRGLLEPLAAGAERHESAAIWDTVGCIHFVLGDRDEAINAFQRAQHILAEETEPLALALRRIVTARIRAAMDTEAHLPTIWGLDGDLTHEGMPVIPEEGGADTEADAELLLEATDPVAE